MARRLVPVLLIGCWLVQAQLRADVPPVKQPTFVSNGVKIHYVVQGKEDGEPVVLIHGFTANIEVQWSPVIKALTKDYKVIAFDNRGHGGSEKPHDPQKYGLEMVKDVVRLLDHLKIERAHIVGYSLGGNIALQVAVRYPERVRTLTVGGAGLPNADRIQMLTRLAESLEQGKGLGPLFIALTPPGQPKPTEEQIKFFNTMLLSQNDPKALAAVLRGAADKEAMMSDDKVRAVKVPSLAVVGELDPLRADTEELKKRLPDMKVVLVPNTDHITAFSNDAFVRAIKDFLDAHQMGKK